MWADHPHFLEVISQGWNTPVCTLSTGN
jgi:hypothetical protein